MAQSKLFSVFVLFCLSLITTNAFAVPSTNEAYRSERLHLVVFKDGQDDTLWFLPPLKLYEQDGKVVFYKRAKEDKVSFYFYILPYMTDEMVDLLAGEIPSLHNRSQLKPVRAKQFGIQVKQFEAAAMGEPVTDDQYLNNPHLIRVVVPATDAEEFEFFIGNKPGIQAKVLFTYESERMDKYLNIELSYKEIYNALNIGASGKYQFTEAEISNAVTGYLSKKYINVKSKGDIQIPDVINKVIEACFEPVALPPDKRKKKPDWGGDWYSTPGNSSDWADVSSLVDGAQSRVGSDDDCFGDPTCNDPAKKKKRTSPSAEFVFKKELATSEQVFYYNQQHYADSTEISTIPVYLSVAPTDARSKVSVTPLEKKQFVVEATNGYTAPYSTGITVRPDEQYIINAVFALRARSKAYDPDLKWYRWDGKWPNADEELYYRVGTGPWTKVNGRTVIKTEGIYKGELQLALDRNKIWEKIPEKDWRTPRYKLYPPAIFEYRETFPQFNVVVTGRKIRMD